MESLYRAQIATEWGTKAIEVCAADITALREKVDILTISSWWNDYWPSQGTVIGALKSSFGIDIKRLASHPAIDARTTCHVWLSDALPARLSRESGIARIGDMELLPLRRNEELENREELVIRCIRSYFRMLDLAAVGGVAMDTIAMPLVGTGHQHVDPDFITAPLITECVRFLKDSEKVRRIVFVERSQSKAFEMAVRLRESYALSQAGRPDAAQRPRDSLSSRDGGVKMESSGAPDVFISYNHKDIEIAKALCAKLEQRGLKVWYAPRDIQSGDYSAAIVRAIEQARYFMILMSANSVQSHHVLNELSLAFDQLGAGHSIIPVRIDQVGTLPGSFDYYLHSLHVKDASTKPLEESIDRLVDELFGN